MSNLEPIDEKDLDLESKFGKSEKPNNINETGKDIDAKGIESEAEKEPAREVILAEKDSAYNKILSKVKTQPTQAVTNEEVKIDAETTYQKQDSEGQIQNLVDIALNKGVVHAVNVAKHLEDNYILDMFHDRLLADELHEALIRKGLIEEV